MTKRIPIYLFTEIEKRLQNGEKISGVSSHKINNRRGCGAHDLITLRVENTPEGNAFIKQLRKDGHVFRTRGRNPNRKQFAGYKCVSADWNTNFVYTIDMLRQSIPLRFSSYFVLFPK